MQLTSQQQADIALQRWQAHPGLTPEERIEMAFYDFLLPPPISMAEFERQLDRIQECIA